MTRLYTHFFINVLVKERGKNVLIYTDFHVIKPILITGVNHKMTGELPWLLKKKMTCKHAVVLSNYDLYTVTRSINNHLI